MFTHSIDIEHAEAILANFGATHFHLSAAGVLSAVAGSQMFIVEGEHLGFRESDADLAAAAIDKAKE